MYIIKYSCTSVYKGLHKGLYKAFCEGLYEGLLLAVALLGSEASQARCLRFALEELYDLTSNLQGTQT